MKSDRCTIAVLVDLPAGAAAGGHVKMWERLAAAAAQSRLPIDLTVYVSGAGATQILAPHVRTLSLPPRFSTARLKFLPYVPDHTDLARYHRQLARHLSSFDIVHTTDAFFAFARTAETLRQQQNFVLLHSFHTDQPAYAAIFAERNIRSWFGNGMIKRLLVNWLRLPDLARWQMRRRLAQHVRRCDHVLATRPEDRALAETALDKARVSRLRLGVDRTVFHADVTARQTICARYPIAAEQCLVLFVGRLDEGKNIYPLLAACASLRQAGYPLHLVLAGVGPAAADAAAQLGEHVTLCGFVPPDELAALYAGCDVLAVPSEVEIGSLVLMEALACGLPVLVSAASRLAELHGPSAAIQPVAAGAAAWAEQLQLLLTEPERLPSMRHAAQDYGQTRIADWNTILREDLFPAWQQALRRRL
jgi:glycosyltransferase involved in cell wall biosynthesis